MMVFDNRSRGGSSITTATEHPALSAYSYDIDGNVHEHFTPRNPLRNAKLLYSFPTSGTGSAFTKEANNTSIQMMNASALKLTRVSGYPEITFSGLNITVPSDGMMQLMFHISGTADVGTIKVRLTDSAGGTIWYDYSNNWYRKNIQQSLVLWNPNTDAHKAFNKSGGATTSTSSTFNFNLPITSIYMSFNNPAVGQVIILDGLYSHPKIKPTYLMVPDYSSNDLATNLIPILNERGFKLTARATVYGLVGVEQDLYDVYLKQMVAEGHDICNGSYSRASMNGASLALTRKEMGLAQNLIRRKFNKNPCLFSSVGNSLPDDSTRRQVMAENGLRWAKAPNGFHLTNYISPNGVCDPTYSIVSGSNAYTSIKNLIDGIMYTGGYLMHYFHSSDNFYNPDGSLSAQAIAQGRVAGEELTTGSTNHGGSVWTEGMLALCDYIKPHVDAGNLQVPTMETFDKQMRGIIDF